MKSYTGGFARITFLIFRVVQCVAVYCSVLQGGVVCCNVLQCVAVCYSVLQASVVCCSVVQCGALWRSVVQCCSVLQTFEKV